MIQTGDPNTKDPEIDRSLWGTGGPGYQIREEFNTLQHDRGIVSMARQGHPDSAGSQFFIVHQDSNHLDKEYTAFGRIVPGFGQVELNGLDRVANLETDDNGAPLDVSKATIHKATILDTFFAAELAEPDREHSIIKTIKTGTLKNTETYYNSEHEVRFGLPYRWEPIEDKSSDYLNVVLQGNKLEHNLQAQIEQSGFTPKVSIISAALLGNESGGVSTAFFSIRGGEEPEILSNYIFENDDMRRAHILLTTQELQTSTETVRFKILQLHFINSELSYSIVYVNVEEWFRYEVMAFVETAQNFEAIFDGEMQPIDFSTNPIFQRVISDAKAEPVVEPPLARIGGCLIATASYGSELAPQVQLLREIRDNTVLQTQSGTSFMTAFNQLYYSFSPTIADYERENVVFKETVKLALTPLLTSLTLLQYVDIDSEYDMLGYGIGIILLNIGMYFVAPAVLITKIRSFYKLQ
jgi:peptidyl-prolyl cis-trans isomerase B (cyclophilin B)